MDKGVPVSFLNLRKRIVIGSNLGEFIRVGERKFLLWGAASELVVVPHGWRMLDYSHYRKTLAKYAEEAGVTYVATHGFRHSASGVYMAHGATPEDMQSLFSHGESRTTRRYLHVPDKRVDKVASVIRLFPEKCSTNVPRSDFSESEIKKEVNQVIEI